MKRFLARLTSFIGSVVLILVMLGVFGAAAAWLFAPTVPDRTLLEADFGRSLAEYLPDDPVTRALSGDTPRLRDTVDALHRGARDDRVVGLVARIAAAPMGLATVQELREAVTAFRAAGKPAIAYAETFGEFGPGNAAYYLATAFDEVYLQPSGDVGLTGLLAESYFVRGTLDKLGVEPRMDHREEYKNALNIFTEKDFTDAHREAARSIMDSMFDQIVGGIAASREITPEQVRALADRGPYLGTEALDADLVDGLAYRDEVYAAAHRRLGDNAKPLYLGAYLDRAGPLHDDGPVVALIYGVGSVHLGESSFDPLTQGVSMGADTVAAAFRKAVMDDVKAIVFRVNSPGGSYVASDTIWRETIRARDAGKPVIVSMGDVAGSGGYFVAMAADRIVAQPGTVTGSIGVLGGKMLTSDFWGRLGITWDSVATGEHADMWTGTQDYSESEWQRMEAALDRIYADFTAKVAQGRKLPHERVLEIAKGRVWTGEQARELDLVDELGGYETALRLARTAAGLAEDADVTLRVYPRPESILSQLLGEKRESSESRAIAAALTRIAAGLRPVVRTLQRVGLYPANEGPLTVPGEWGVR
jgi:protease-4